MHTYARMHLHASVLQLSSNLQQCGDAIYVRFPRSWKQKLLVGVAVHICKLMCVRMDGPVSISAPDLVVLDASTQPGQPSAPATANYLQPNESSIPINIYPDELYLPGSSSPFINTCASPPSQPCHLQSCSGSYELHCLALAV